MSFLMPQTVANQLSRAQGFPVPQQSDPNVVGTPQSQAARRTSSNTSTPVPIAKAITPRLRNIQHDVADLPNPYATSQGPNQSNITTASNNPFRSQVRQQQTQQNAAYSGGPSSILHQNVTSAALAYTSAQQSMHNLQQHNLQQQNLQQQNLQQNIQPNLQNIQPNLQNIGQSSNSYAQPQQSHSNGPVDTRSNQQMTSNNNHGGVNGGLNGQQPDGQDQWGLMDMLNRAPNQDTSANNADFDPPHGQNEHSHPVSNELQAANDGEENNGRSKSQSGEPLNPRDLPADFQNPYYPMMTQPPENTYPSFDELYAAAQAHAREAGYAFVIQRSKRKKNGLKKVLLGCDRNGVSRERMAPGMRKRKTTSRKTGCEFSVYADEEKGQWALKWRSDGTGHRGVQPGMGAYWRHNHPPSENPLDHPRHRKMDQGTVAAVKALKDAGVSARETIQILQAENPETLLTSRDIYNARSGLAHGRINIDPEVMEMTPNFTILTKEEKLRNELRQEIFQYKTKLENTEKELADAKKQIEKYEGFIDLINSRVGVNRPDNGEGGSGPGQQGGFQG